MNFLNFTFFKNMTTRIKNSYYCLKLRKKALVLFLLFGTCLTIPLAAISSIFLMHYLTSEEQKNLKQTLSQSVSQIESDLSLYTALSDYCFNDTELASILNQTYIDNYFDMYKALENTIIPMFRTYQLLHPNLRSIRLRFHLREWRKVERRRSQNLSLCTDSLFFDSLDCLSTYVQIKDDDHR